MEIKIKKPSSEEIQEANNWSVWEKEESEFPWTYDSKETCYILEGEAEVSYEGKTAKFGKGDWVEFPEGLNCTWKITKKIKKHYNFS